MKAAERSKIRTFEDLECWKQCRMLRLFIAKEVVPTLPKDERYRLGDQLLANIAEGYGRFDYLDNAKFGSNSPGSCWEILDHLITGNDENFISAELLNRGRILVDQAVRLLNGYMNYLKRAHIQTTSNQQPITDN